MIAVVDYGSGNLHSIGSAFDMIGADVVVTNKPEDLQAAGNFPPYSQFAATKSSSSGMK